MDKIGKIFYGTDCSISIELEDADGASIDLLDDEIVESVRMRFFTKKTKPTDAITKTLTDIKEGNLLQLDKSEIANLSPGLIYMDIYLKFVSESFTDGIFDLSEVVETNIYLQGGIKKPNEN